MQSMQTYTETTCSCESIGRSDLRMCPDHHRYWRGDKELTSVSKIIRSCWPVKKNFEDVPPEILEHARERGVRIDAYFTKYVDTGRVRIAAGEWREVVVGLQAVIDWYDARVHSLREVGFIAETQVMLADDTVAGTTDLLFHPLGQIYDLKCVSALDPTYDIQIGAYADMHGGISEGYLIQCKIDAKNLQARVTCMPVDIKQAVCDWRHMKQVWLAAQRRVKT